MFIFVMLLIIMVCCILVNVINKLSMRNVFVWKKFEIL